MCSRDQPSSSLSVSVRGSHPSTNRLTDQLLCQQAKMSVNLPCITSRPVGWAPICKQPHACAHFTHTKNSKRCREDTMWEEEEEEEEGSLIVVVWLWKWTWIAVFAVPWRASRALSHLAEFTDQVLNTHPSILDPSKPQKQPFGLSVVTSTWKTGAFIRTNEWRKTNLQSIIIGGDSLHCRGQLAAWTPQILNTERRRWDGLCNLVIASLAHCALWAWMQTVICLCINLFLHHSKKKKTCWY